MAFSVLVKEVAESRQQLLEKQELGSSFQENGNEAAAYPRPRVQITLSPSLLCLAGPSQDSDQEFQLSQVLNRTI